MKSFKDYISEDQLLKFTRLTASIVDRYVVMQVYTLWDAVDDLVSELHYTVDEVLTNEIS